jgi:formylglycine-generating enzyme required for sulfatase activity
MSKEIKVAIILAIATIFATIITVFGPSLLKKDNPPSNQNINKGTIVVTSDPVVQDARVFINGKGKGTIPFSLKLPEGEYKVEVKTDTQYGKKDVIIQNNVINQTVIPLKNIKNDIKIQVAQYQKKEKEEKEVARERAGKIAVTIKPIVHGAKVFINGEYKGRIPFYSDDMPVGTYKLEVKTDTHYGRKDIMIQDNERNEVVVSLQRFETITNSIGMKFVYVKPGTFKMGSNDGHDDEKPVHKVTLKKSFYMQTTEVTQGQWRAVMGNNPSYFKNCGDDCPVESVSWNDAKDFIKKLNKMEGNKYRLPTEAQWEYAARGGEKSKGYKYSGSDNLDKVAWYDKNSNEKTHIVATKKPNELGLYDMSGNVWEWCEDKWHSNYEGAPDDGSAWETGESSFRVFRGGSWNDDAQICRVACRLSDCPEHRFRAVGFRLVLVPQFSL